MIIKLNPWRSGSRGTISFLWSSKNKIEVRIKVMKGRREIKERVRKKERTRGRET